MELEEVNWRMVVVMVAADNGCGAGGLGRKRGAKVRAALGLARLLYRAASGRSDYDRLSAVSIPLGFHHHWPPASSQVATGPLPSHHWGSASFHQTLCWVS